MTSSLSASVLASARTGPPGSCPAAGSSGMIAATFATKFLIISGSLIAAHCAENAFIQALF